MRLTIRNSDGTVSQPMNLDWAGALEKLAAYEDAEEQGLLVRLPCKVGDTFYYIAGTLRGNEYVASDTVEAIELSDTEPWIVDSCGCYHGEFWMTRAEAEAALKGETKDV